jgi:drug/metabolite transporter (DMT)-like permease
MAFWGNVCFLLCALVLSALYGGGAFGGASHPSLAFLTRGWVAPTAADLALMASCGLIAAVGITLLTYAYRIAPSASVAPFEYSFMFWGLLWGWLFWDNIPDTLAWVGIAVIIGAGMIVIRKPEPQAAAA